LQVLTSRTIFVNFTRIKGITVTLSYKQIQKAIKSYSRTCQLFYYAKWICSYGRLKMGSTTLLGWVGY